MKSLTLIVVLFCWPLIPTALAGPAAGSAQTVAGARSTPLNRAVTVRSAAAITGWAVTAGNTPIPHARVRLRNLDKARIEGTTRTNYLGEFSFTVREGGTYIVELLDDEARVVAVGEPFAVEAGRTAGTLVRLPSRVPSVAVLFGNTAGAIVAAAAGMGITAVSTTGRAASPER